jgi:hypothetical protein
MAYTQDDLEAIRRARVSPNRRMKTGADEIERKADAELRQIEEDITRALAVSAPGASGQRPRRRVRVVCVRDL